MRKIEQVTWKTNIGNYEVVVPVDLTEKTTDELLSMRKKMRWLLEDCVDNIEHITKIIEERVK